MTTHITLTENEVLKLSVILSEVQIKFLDERRHSDSELTIQLTSIQLTIESNFFILFYNTQ